MGDGPRSKKGVVTPDLVRGPAAVLDRVVEQIVPIRIGTLDQFEFPVPLLALDALLLRDARNDIVGKCDQDEFGQTVFRAKFRTRLRAMLLNSRWQVSSNTDVHSAPIPIDHDINPTAAIPLTHRA